MSDNGVEPQEQEPSSISVTFTPDGQMGLHVGAGIGPPQLWAAARLIELWGDSAFAEQQLAAAERGKRIAIPGRPRGLRS